MLRHSNILKRVASAKPVSAIARCTTRTNTSNNSSFVSATNSIKKFDVKPYTRSYATVASDDLSSRLYHLVTAYRTHGHTAANLDPLGLEKPVKSVALNVGNYNLNKFLSEDDDTVFKTDGILSMGSEAKQSPFASLPKIVEHLNNVYCKNVASQFAHVENVKEYMWIAREIETNLSVELDPEEKKRINELMLKSELFDQFLAKKFASTKRYGLEGCESMMPAVDTILRELNKAGFTDVVIGMPHRGRLNLLVELLGYPAVGIFAKIKGHSEVPDTFKSDADVLSHLGISADLDYGQPDKIHVSLLHNPSHLEAINPVALGKAKAKAHRGKKAACITIHGDAAFAGQGINQEFFTMSNLKHFSVDGTIHLIVNNQLGFTTPAKNGRSSRFSGDLAKMIGAPMFHVNAESPEDIVRVMKIAVAYKQKFKKDVVVEVIGWRKWGHNELDEPAFTQPKMYSIVRSKKSIPRSYSEKLISEGTISAEEVKEIEEQTNAGYEKQLQAVETYKPEPFSFQKDWSNMQQAKNVSESVPTGVNADTLKSIAKASVAIPEGFTVHDRLRRHHIEARLKSIDADEIDWATAEAMAVGSLMKEGIHVRLCGQDVERGTFNQRHWVFTDQKTEDKLTPLHHLEGVDKKTLQVVPSPLSELGVLGYEFGYSMDHPNNLNLWEAQFGDFFNGAQIIIDTFLSSAEDKWVRQSALTVLLPHGYDGAGPEHSSCRIERFLQLTNGQINTNEEQQTDVNMIVINPTTPANYFHALRRQMHRNFRKPMVVVGPKKLLKLPQAVSSIADMSEGTSFQPVLSDPTIKPEQYSQVQRVILCSGKIFYELDKERNENANAKALGPVPIIRLEELSPFPYQQLHKELAKFSNAKTLIWHQEEPENMGAYTYVEPRLRRMINKQHKNFTEFRYVGRDAAASPAIGVPKEHEKQQKKLLADAFN